MSQIALYREKNWSNILQEDEILSSFKKEEKQMETIARALCCSWIVTGIAHTWNFITNYAMCRSECQPRVPDDHIPTSVSLVCFWESRNLNLLRLQRITKNDPKDQHQ